MFSSQREARLVYDCLWNKMRNMKSNILAGEGNSKRLRDLIQEGPVASQLDKFKLLYSQINLATLMVIHDILYRTFLIYIFNEAATTDVFNPELVPITKRGCLYLLDEQREGRTKR